MQRCSSGISECGRRPESVWIPIAARARAAPRASDARGGGGATARSRTGDLGNLFYPQEKRQPLHEPIAGRTHRPSLPQADQRNCGRCRLHDGRRFDESRVCLTSTSRASSGTIRRGCLATQAKWRACLDVSPTMRYIPPDLVRLKPFYRRLLYGVVALLFLTGAAWAYWNFFVPSPSDFELGLKALAMKMHGAAAMAILVLIGMLLTGHVRFAWRARRNRGNGSLF